MIIPLVTLQQRVSNEQIKLIIILDHDLLVAINDGLYRHEGATREGGRLSCRPGLNQPDESLIKPSPFQRGTSVCVRDPFRQLFGHDRAGARKYCDITETNTTIK